jgi:hypothetical protein
MGVVGEPRLVLILVGCLPRLAGFCWPTWFDGFLLTRPRLIDGSPDR